MAEEVEVTRDDESQAEALQQAISGPQAEAFDICATWNLIKPFWPWIIRIVSKIPRIGGIIGKALEWLGKALDGYCEKK
jgi:hypothetical protein